MTYAGHRAIYDADGHIMELPTHLRDFADPDIRDQIPLTSYSASSVTEEEVAVLVGQGGKHSDEHLNHLRSLGNGLIAQSKEIQALGAFDGRHRSQALDMLGFKKQIIFSTLSARAPFSTKLSTRVKYGAVRAHTRAMTAFCGDDERLMGMACISLDEPDLAVQELEFALQSGMGGIWVPHRICGDKSPGHPDFDAFWARLAESGVPFLIHIGGSDYHIDPAWFNNGQPLPKDAFDGGENVRALDYSVLHHAAERFISAMVLSGVFERHRKLKGAAVELGASWVPSFLKILDNTVHAFSRVQPELAAMSRKPSEQITEQMGFTAFPFEDVGTLIAHSNSELYMFASDYPHIEGGKDPLGSFDAFLANHNACTLDNFYVNNFRRVFGV
jgi:predicted TIM-barrel fold metal-dependent hydrolase